MQRTPQSGHITLSWDARLCRSKCLNTFFLNIIAAAAMRSYKNIPKSQKKKKKKRDRIVYTIYYSAVRLFI